MTTSMPPAWNFLLERDQCPECRCAPNMPHNADCANLDDGEPLIKVMDTDVNKWSISGDNRGCNIPFWAQSWTFEARIEREVDHLHEIIDDHHDEIVEMARRRHEKGFISYGSKGYQWDAKTRLRNVLEELSDAPTYLTMGPIE